MLFLKKSSFPSVPLGRDTLPLMKVSPLSDAPVARKITPVNPFAPPAVFPLTPHTVRRTDEQARQNTAWPRRKASYADVHAASLKDAAATTNTAGSGSGVYILRLNGSVLKVGSAEIGVRKRMQQYYGLNKYCGHPQITEENRDLIAVTWQNCPVGKCNELESKLAQKYGLGSFAKRTPHSAEDTWELLI